MMIGVQVMMTPPSTNAHSQWNLLRRHSLHSPARTPLPSSRAKPARDRVIDFGRHKGKMLGMLPSSYLRWVSNNLRARDTEEWAQLADQVLQDPVYRDRMEWESAERVLKGEVAGGGSESAVSELLEISERFGWDNEDKPGWGRVDFELLGTSKGERIPRKSDDGKGKGKGQGKGKGKEVYSESESPSQEEERRRERRHRLRLKRESGGGQNRVIVGGSQREARNGGAAAAEAAPEPIYNPFPGRESLLRKVLDGKSPL